MIKSIFFKGAIARKLHALLSDSAFFSTMMYFFVVCDEGTHHKVVGDGH